MPDRNLTIERVIPDYRGWLRKVAGSMLHPAHEALDDLIQEGYIAMWRALESHKPDSAPIDYWLKRSAHQRMLTVVARNHWTGQSKRSPGAQPDQPVLALESIEALDPADRNATDALEAALWGYHRGRLLQVLDGLTERERQYVLRRFWGGAQQPELDAYFGTHSPNIWKTARVKLRDGLDDLRGDLA